MISWIRFNCYRSAWSYGTSTAHQSCRESKERRCSAVVRGQSLKVTSKSSDLDPWSLVCSGFQFSEDTGRIIRQTWRQKKRPESCKASVGEATQKADELRKRLSRKTNIHIRCARHTAVLSSVLLRFTSSWRLKGRPVADDVLASAGEQLHLPVPRVSVHCTGQRSEGTNINWHANSLCQTCLYCLLCLTFYC